MSQTFDTSSQNRAAAEAAGPSISGPFQARVKGSDARGDRFKFSTLIENLSAGRCDVRLEGVPEPGGRISVAARVSRALVILRGNVLGVTSRAGGPRRAAVEITRYRFVHRRPEPPQPEPSCPDNF